MMWEPITINELNTLINSGTAKLTANQLLFWNTVKILPEKWDNIYLGERESFWVITLFGKNVIWYNDVEQGFNVSSYNSYGTIETGNLGAEQDELNWCINKIIN